MTFYATIRKDDFTPSRPWCADMHLENDKVVKSAFYNYRTKKALIHAIEATGAIIQD